MLGARHPDGDRQPQFLPNAPADRLRNFGGAAEQVGAARYVGKRFVDRDAFDQRCVVVEDADRRIAQPLVLLVVPAHEDQVGAECLRLPSTHAPADSEFLGLVGGGKDHAAAHRDGFSHKRWIEHLLDLCC